MLAPSNYKIRGVYTIDVKHARFFNTIYIHSVELLFKFS